MKKLLLLLTALMAAFLLAGCSVSDFLSNLDTDKISDWIFSVTEVELDPVPTAEDIRNSLPDELSDITVDETALGCDTVHIAIKSRDTDTTRQTDEVLCLIEISGDGITLRYLCSFYYTYTSSGGWGLTEWSIDSDSIDLSVSEGVLTDQLESTTVSSLESQYGEDSVEFHSGSWDQSTMCYTAVYDVEAENSYVSTQGTLTLSAELEMNVSSGLNFDWDVTADESEILYGLETEETTWLVSGTVDTTAVQLAVSFSETDLDAQTVTISAAAAVLEDGDYSFTIRTLEDETVEYTVEEGMITFSFDLLDFTWSCCFDADDQWARMDGSYISSLKLSAKRYIEADDLTDLLSEDVESEEDDALDYDTNTAGYTYTASDGTLVYEMQAKYPQFSDSGTSSINSAILTTVQAFLGEPAISTTQSDLNTLAEEAEEEGSSITLPCSDELTVSVVFNQNNFLSLLYVYEQLLEDGEVTYRYEGLTYDLTTGEELDEDDVYSGTGRTIGATILSYAEDLTYTEAAVLSYVEAWVMTPDGLVFYVLTDEETGECEAVTVPYAEAICLLDPTMG